LVIHLTKSKTEKKNKCKEKHMQYSKEEMHAFWKKRSKQEEK